MLVFIVLKKTDKIVVMKKMMHVGTVLILLSLGLENLLAQNMENIQWFNQPKKMEYRQK